MFLSFCFSKRIISPYNVSLVKAHTLRSVHNGKPKSGKSSIRHYLLCTYMRFVEQFSSAMEKRFPKTVRTYRQFTWGTKDFYTDLKVYFAIVKKKNKNIKGLSSLTRHELELYHKVPKDIAKITPLLVLSMLPFALNVILPLVYLFPRQLLTSQFWNLQQRAEFSIYNQRKRLRWYKPVFRSLQAHLDTPDVACHPCYKDWEHVIRLLGSGLHPTAEGVIKCKPLFIGLPYHLNKIYTFHVISLLKMHDMKIGLFPRSRLQYRAKIIKSMDLAIIREGGVNSLTLDELRWACSFRGLNPTNMKTEDMVSWLNAWLKISSVVDSDSWSLLLHCPVLLSYNQPSNWALKY